MLLSIIIINWNWIRNRARFERQNETGDGIERHQMRQQSNCISVANAVEICPSFWLLNLFLLPSSPHGIRTHTRLVLIDEATFVRLRSI